jgi:hypothetical protein
LVFLSSQKSHKTREVRLGEVLLSLVELGATRREVVARYHSLTKKAKKLGHISEGKPHFLIVI